MPSAHYRAEGIFFYPLSRNQITIRLCYSYTSSSYLITIFHIYT